MNNWKQKDALMMSISKLVFVNFWIHVIIFAGVCLMKDDEPVFNNSSRAVLNFTDKEEFMVIDTALQFRNQGFDGPGIKNHPQE